jgi:hypothetical protein
MFGDFGSNKENGRENELFSIFFFHPPFSFSILHPHVSASILVSASIFVPASILVPASYLFLPLLSIILFLTPQ